MEVEAINFMEDVSVKGAEIYCKTVLITNLQKNNSASYRYPLEYFSACKRNFSAQDIYCTFAHFVPLAPPSTHKQNFLKHSCTL